MGRGESIEMEFSQYQFSQQPQYIQYSMIYTLGWGLDHFIVLRGFLMSYGWFAIFLLLTGIAFSLRR